jgi:hypothetical protein
MRLGEKKNRVFPHKPNTNITSCAEHAKSHSSEFNY